MPQLRFGTCVLDLDGRRLYRASEEVHVTPKAFDLLRLLIENRDRAVSKVELTERIWPNVHVTEDGLARLINEIRNAIGDDARHPRWIRTVHGYGYAFQGQVDGRAAAPAPLRDGDEIRVGDFSLVFREVDAQPTVTHLA